MPSVIGLGFAEALRIGEVLETMTGSVIPMKFNRHPSRLQGGFIVIDILGGRALIIVAEDAEKRARDAACQLNGRRRREKA